MVNNYTLNCEGLVCPMPVVKTKRKLIEMEIGDILEITGDFVEASENIKRFVENQGYNVLEHIIKGENYHLRIQKS
ncbi:MAG: sulfurtransferase TusA family protein [Candidatus Lokiarchaeota archaeon]|nr:sulfurtransferase TusA family protein [Candidatus Lokiarchaeota archaeon]